jgi:hypothetical protein
MKLSIYRSLKGGVNINFLEDSWKLYSGKNSDPEMVSELRRHYELDPIYSKHEAELLEDYISKFGGRITSFEDLTEEVI